MGGCKDQKEQTELEGFLERWAWREKQQKSPKKEEEKEL